MINDNIIIGVDIDGILRDLAAQITEFMDVDHPYKEWDREFSQWDLTKTLDMSQEELDAWIYDERVFHLFGMAPKTYKKVIDDLNMFAQAAETHGYSVVISSAQKGRAVTATLHWLSKNGCRIQNYLFFDSIEDKLNGPFDIVVDDNPSMLEKWAAKPPIVRESGEEIPRAIGVEYNYNEHMQFTSLDLDKDGLDELHDILDVERILKKE